MALSSSKACASSELEEAMCFIVQTLQRMPAHWVDRRAKLHAQLDALLVDWEQAQ